MGLPADADDDQSVTDGTPPEREGFAATLVRCVLQDEGMVVRKTFKGDEPTLTSIT